MSGRSRRSAAGLSLAILVLMSLSPVLIDGLSESSLARSASGRSEGRDDGSHGSIRMDGFGFESATRDEVQWMLDQGHTIEEVRAELGEEE